jgi:spore germination cell wall hydrolase CwlJ-like protein
LIKLLGGRVASAIVGLSALAMGSSATAQDYTQLNVSAAIKSLDVNNGAPNLGASANVAATLAKPAVATTTAVTTTSGNIVQAQPAKSVTVSLTPSIATEAAWLAKGGWGLDALVGKYATSAPLDQQTNCLATAVYYEARGESLDGQLAVARVIMNRASSGRYPSDWCGVVTQPWQFSFVNPHTGALPQADVSSTSWRKAEAVAMLAAAKVIPTVGDDVLWYHANYVAPSWGHRLQLAQRIGAHIFYRA